MMMFIGRGKQSGAATLLFCAMLLASALIITLSSFNQLFRQAKRVQNEIQARQLHWQAEGRLACVMAKVYNLPANIPYSKLATDLDLTECDTPSAINLIQQVTPTHYTVSSQGKGYTIQNTLTLPDVGRIGALAINADGYFLGEFRFQPQVFNTKPSGSSECISVSYSKSLYLAPNSQLSTQSHIFTAPKANCDIKFVSNVQNFINQTSWLDITQKFLSLDYIFNPNFEPLEQVFSIEKSDLASLKQKFTVIQGGLCNVNLANPLVRDPYHCQCDKSLAQQIVGGKKLIWIEGDCDIGLGVNTRFANQAQGSTGIIVVVHNGLFSSMDAVPFNGIFYQLYDDQDQPQIAKWDKLTGKQAVQSFYTLTGQVPVIYMMKPAVVGGSNAFNGLVVIDAYDQVALFEGTIDFVYKYSVLEAPLRQFLKPKWLKGAWRDF